MAKDVQKVIAVRPQFQVNRGAAKLDSGLATRYIASAIYDTAGNDSSLVSNKTIAAHGTGVYIPAGAIITKVWIDVITTFTSATDAATIAIMAQTANDIRAEIAISNGTNVWDAGVGGSIVGNAALDGNARTAIAAGAAEAAAVIKCTAERELVATVAVEALTAGKAVIHAEYILSTVA